MSCPDFHQLPSVGPLLPLSLATAVTLPGRKHERGCFLFESKAWREAGFQMFKLTHSWRYGKDAHVVTVAGGLQTAVGLISSETFYLMSQVVAHPPHDRPNGEVEICATRKRAREINELRLRDLQGLEYEYTSVDKH